MATLVYFNSTALSTYTVVNTFAINFLTPYLPPGTYTVTVVVDGVTSSSYEYVIDEPVSNAMITAVTDYATQATNRLLRQYYDKENIKSLIKAYIGNRIQDLSNAISTLYRPYDFYALYGDRLDHVGELVGQYRNGMDDDLYRQFIYARILANKSNGSRDSILEIIYALTAATNVNIIEGHEEGESAQYRVVITESPAFPIDSDYHLEYYRVIKDATSMGIGIEEVFIDDGLAHFTLGPGPTSPATEVINYATGFGDNDVPGIGGTFSNYIK